jgi:aminoglycoside 6'-N-acetyltransferase I
VILRVRPVVREDAGAWLRMRRALWPEHEGNWHANEIEEFLAGRSKMPLAVLVAVDQSDQPIGFVELFIRPYAEDCDTDRVAYLEGWYVEQHYRRRGVGRALIEASEQWGREQGCTEFGSDALIDNDVSAAAHAALGFVETVQIRCFKKKL